MLIAASKLDTSDRPAVPEYVRVHTPCVVTSDDLDDVTTKMQNLEFDISTLVSWRLTRPGGGDGVGGGRSIVEEKILFHRRHKEP